MSTRVRTKPYRCGYTCNHLIDPAAPPNLATISYGGGVQSTALLVLAAQGRIDFRTFLFCNVGDDSEHPATLEYVASASTRTGPVRPSLWTRRGRSAPPLAASVCGGARSVWASSRACRGGSKVSWPSSSGVSRPRPESVTLRYAC